MQSAIECAGHPRDLGLEQGAALGRSIREACAAAGLPTRRSRIPTLRALCTGPLRSQGAGREFFRHFAHQAERLEGLARTAGVPVDSLLALHLQVRAGGATGGLLSRRSWLRVSDGDADVSRKRTLIERSLPTPGPGEAGWMLRESRPAVGFRSVEVGLPWLVPAVAGINEAGLAIAAGPILWGETGTAGLPPSALLVQECLQRFEDLAGAIDWCRKRPVEGEQSFVVADASGSVVTLISSGRERRVQEGEGELYLEGGELPADPARESAEPGSDSAGRVTLDPVGRGLRLEASGANVELNLAGD